MGKGILNKFIGLKYVSSMFSNTEEIPVPGLRWDRVSEIPYVLELVEHLLQNHTPGVANLALLPTGEVDTELHGDETMPSTEMEGPRCSQQGHSRPAS